MSVELHNEILIERPPQAVFDYVTQPWRWHEWHPSSLWGNDPGHALAVGEHFDERIMVQPLAPLPPRIRRAVRYRVLASEPPLLWETRGEMANGWLQIRYQLKMASSGTRFHRQLNFDVSGPLRLLRPLLTRRQRAVSGLALTQLKDVLESTADTGGRA